MNHVTRFLQMYGDSIHTASIEDGSLFISLKPTVPVSHAFMLFADLVNTLNPHKTEMEDFHTIRVYL